MPARWVSATLTGHATSPQTVGNPQPIVSFEYRVALVPAASAYVSNPDVSLARAIPGAYDTLKLDEGEFGVFWELRKLVVGDHAVVNREIVLTLTP